MNQYYDREKKAPETVMPETPLPSLSYVMDGDTPRPLTTDDFGGELTVPDTTATNWQKVSETETTMTIQIMD